MKFVNVSNNTIYLSDINKNIKFSEGKEENISLDDVKRSEQFRTLVMLKKIKITECGNSMFERNLLKIQDKKIDFLQDNNEMKSIENVNNQLEVRIKGHFYEAGGYAKKNRNLLVGLSKLGVNVEAVPVGKKSEISEIEAREINKASKKVSNKCVLIDSMIPTFSEMGNGYYRILNTTIESYSIPKQFIDAINNYNEIWVTVDFCKEILKKHDIKKPIFVIPDSINCSLYNENVNGYSFDPPLNKFVFLSVFSWGYRKGYDVLLRSYLEEFSSDDDVSLAIMTRYIGDFGDKDTPKEVISEYTKKYKKEKSPHIARIKSVIPERLMPSLYKSCNAFVLPTRGEAMCLPILEASLCGLPIISTKCSGHGSYLTYDNSNLIEIDQISPIQNGQMHIHYWDDQLFPSLTSDEVIKSTRRQMRWVYDNYKQAKVKNKKLQEHILKNFDINIVAELAKNRLDNIWSNIK